MSEGVNVMVLPGGERIVLDEDDARVQATALRLGVIEKVSAEINKCTGQRGVSVLMRDGDRLVAVVAWTGFDDPTKNGWASVSITPANEKTAGWLVNAARRIIGAYDVRMVKGGAPWN